MVILMLNMMKMLIYKYMYGLCECKNASFIHMFHSQSVHESTTCGFFLDSYQQVLKPSLVPVDFILFYFQYGLNA